MSHITRRLTPPEVEDIQLALANARAGRGSLKHLANAHELASTQGGDLPVVLGEIREHIRRMTPGPILRTEAKSVLLGVISGFITWTMLGRRPDAR